MTGSTPRAARLLPLLGFAAWLATSCAWIPIERPGTEEPLRISQLEADGDPQRRASMLLVVEALEADEQRASERALTGYERALQVDPTNPYAYIALARHLADGLEPERAIPFLDQARALLQAQGEDSPRADVALMGIRGQALVASGRYEDGLHWIERAREVSPDVWSDGRLSAAELR